MPKLNSSYLDKTAFGVILIGPSGSGKTTLRDALLDYKLKDFKLVQYRPYTSRAKRSGESDEYHFVNDAKLNDIHKNKLILFRNEYHGNKFLTTWPASLPEKQFYIYIYSPTGATEIKSIFKNHKIIQIIPDDEANIRNVLTQRDPGISKSELERRLEIVPKEVEQGGRVADYVFKNKMGIKSSVEQLAKIIDNLYDRSS